MDHSCEVAVTREEFEDYVEEAMRDLPKEIASLMDNIVVEVADRPTRKELMSVGLRRGHLLLGRYHGVPLGERGRHRYGNVLPDRVTIYQQNLEAAFPPEELVKAIRDTVLHEVGHHFGLTDEQLLGMGY